MQTHNMTGRPKTGKELLKIVEEDIAYIWETYGVLVVAWITDDSPNGKKMRRLLDLVTAPCLAHQFNLVVGNCLKLLPLVKGVIIMALDIIKWFNNHSVALHWL